MMVLLLLSTVPGSEGGLFLYFIIGTSREEFYFCLFVFVPSGGQQFERAEPRQCPSPYEIV